MADFQFTFDPNLFPEPPAVPPSSELFSTSESSNIFGFLDNFNSWVDGDLTMFQHGNYQPFNQESYMNGYTDSKPANSEAHSSSSSLRTHPYASHRRSPSEQTSPLSPSSPSALTKLRSSSASSGPGPTRSKPLLTDPQKRMNHIMSEQKRRNAIREGYAQLTALLAPAGAPPGTGMPTRGRPKGSGAKGKGKPGAGKSGVLLRAVEYCRWLEEGRNALLAEVRRLEAAADIDVNC